ncbi:hypothetical protein N9J47_02280 [Flavobacteriaceae bacterium]|nr:hypothetical protein [Flavobacteriaceae bacterium]
MKKFLLLFLFIPLTSCLEKESCGIIVQKYTESGKYFFAMTAIGNVGGNNGGGDVFGDAEVNKKTYESYNIDDEYCIE